jgi:ABC-type lipoprotein release transport system permease subunit
MTGAMAALREARRGLATRRRRAAVTGAAIGLAAAMLAAAIVVSDGLGFGFDRAARAADLPDLIVRFAPQSRSVVARRIEALPDLAGYSTRQELTNVGIHAAGAGRRRDDAVAEVLGSGTRRGYAVVAGRDLRPTGDEVLVEKAFADSWGLRVGSTLDVSGLGPERVVGLVEAPDNVGFPLAKPRFYLALSALQARFGFFGVPRVDVAEIWVRNERYLNELLVQARSTSFGLRGLRFATRSGVHVLLDQAAGIVIDLLVALSLIALATAGAMLAASARAEVQRRLGTIGVQRAVGATGGHVTLVHALEAWLVAAPAAAVGSAAGAVVIYGPASRLLTLLNEPAPGGALVLPLLGGWLAACALAVGGAAWPAARAASRPVTALLRGADVSGRSGRRIPGLGWLRPTGLAALGARLVAARRARLVVSVTMLGLSAAFVLLLLSLASELSALQTDPGALGKRYALTASLPPSAAARVRRIPGVAAVAPRYEVQAVDSFSLGETIDVIAYPGDHTVFEAPTLTSGHRLRGIAQAEIGLGLAQALGLSPGQTLALALPSGTELRLRVAGVVSSLDHDGRVAYVPAAALIHADPGAGSVLAIRLTPNADSARISRALAALGIAPAAATGATARGAPLVAVLKAIVRVVAIVDGLVCLYALIQACMLTMLERRRTVAVLRACGGSAAAVRRLLYGATLTLLVPSALTGYLLERFVLGPAVSRLAESYATLPLQATTTEVALTAAGLLAGAVAAVWWVALQARRESVLSGLAS